MNIPSISYITQRIANYDWESTCSWILKSYTLSSFQSLVTDKVLNEITHRSFSLRKDAEALNGAVGLCFIAINWYVQPKETTTFVALCIAYVAVGIYQRRVGYSPEAFHNQLKSGEPFPPGPVIVRGDLSFTSPFPTLPKELKVEGSLSFSESSGLTLLPEELYVRDNLDLTGCKNVTSLIEEMRVGGDLLLFDTGLTSLPSWITELDSKPGKKLRRVNLERTPLSEEIKTKLRELDPNETGIIFQL